MYKAADGISPEIMNDILNLRDDTHYHLRYTSQFLANPIYSVFKVKNQFHVSNTILAQIWE